MIDCLDDERIALFLEGRLTVDARAEVEAHLDGCAACRRLVAAAAPSVASAASVGSEPARASRMPSLGRGAAVGRYLVLGPLGRGGMGVVYAAYDVELDRRVALKFLHAAHDSERARKALVSEARALARLSHPNVVQVHDVGEHDGDVFVAMELVEGQSLETWCRATPRPGWRDVVHAYTDAARGLSSAHAKGLVHRDVKPSNILRGDDGRVRVADFGLASDREAAATSAIVGTPLYMAPEQHEGRPATAASDQYSLCLALYQGLYGSTPFASSSTPSPDTLAELARRKQAGPPQAAPVGSAVPAWLHGVLARGLAADPADRYPSLDALVAALGDDPEARRRGRRRTALVAGVLAALSAVGAIGWVKSGAFDDPCAEPERQLEGVWDPAVEARVRAAFLASGRPHAADTVARVVAQLDRRAAAWAEQRGEVCVMSRRGTERVGLAELRDTCLDRRRSQLQALTTLFASGPDPAVVDRAVKAAANLPALDYCADVAALTARVQPAEDPAVRARVAELEREVDRLEALRLTGKFQVGLPPAVSLVAAAEAVGYAPLVAQARLRLGQLREGAGDYDGAEAMFRAASVAAAEGMDDALVVNAWSGLLFVVGERKRNLEEARVIESLGATVVARAHDERAQAGWLNSAGLVLAALGRHADARALHERALAIYEAKHSAEHPDIVSTLNNLANAFYLDGDYVMSRALYERALAMSERLYGAEHPDVANLLYNLGNTLDVLGDWTAARALLTRALAIREKTLPPDHPAIASTLTNLGVVAIHLADPATAKVVSERAVAIKAKAFGVDHISYAHTLAGLGRAEVVLGHYDVARPLLEQAVATMEKAQGPTYGGLTAPLLALGELSLGRGEPTQALLPLERALAIETEMDFKGEIELTLADALWQIGADRPRARTLASDARAIYTRLGHRPGEERAAAWLAAHAAAPGE